MVKLVDLANRKSSFLRNLSRLDLSACALDDGGAALLAAALGGSRRRADGRRDDDGRDDDGPPVALRARLRLPPRHLQFAHWPSASSFFFKDMGDGATS